MKKNLLFKLTLAYAITFLNFQNVSAQKTLYWNLGGNSNATSSSILGTTNATDLRIVSNNFERIRITSTGLVGIGTNSPTYKLHVIGNALFTTGVTVSDGGISGYSSTTTVAVYGSNSGGGNGVFGSGTVGVNGYGNIGVNGNGITGVNGQSNSTNGIGVSGSGGGAGVAGFGAGYGVQGQGTSSSSIGVGGFAAVHGVYGEGGYDGVSGTGVKFGVTGYTNGNSDALHSITAGVYGYNANYGVGVYGYCGNGSAIYGYSPINYYAGWFDGNVYSSGAYVGSDRKLKKNINDFSSAMDIINKLQPKSYQYRQDGNYKLMNLPAGNHYGLIAQDLEQVLPELVKETKFDPRMAHPEIKDISIPSQKNISEEKQSQITSNKNAINPNEIIDFKAVNYTELIPIMIKAMQEQQQQIEELKKLVNKLAQGQIRNVIANGTLGQNSPNPVNNSTIIQYSIPSGINSAQLLLTDNTGRTIKSVQLDSSGLINLDASGLSNGVYNYSLIVDGKIAETKKMIVVRN
jgi:hypothetical protein